MAKTSESVSVLVRSFLWQTASLAMLPVLAVMEIVRWSVRSLRDVYEDRRDNRSGK